MLFSISICSNLLYSSLFWTLLCSGPCSALIFSALFLQRWFCSFGFCSVLDFCSALFLRRWFLQFWILLSSRPCTVLDFCSVLIYFALFLQRWFCSFGFCSVLDPALFWTSALLSFFRDDSAVLDSALFWTLLCSFPSGMILQFWILLCSGPCSVLHSVLLCSALFLQRWFCRIGQN